MKITCKAKEFIRCVNLLKSVVPLRSPMPAITGILVVKDGPTMRASNARSGMSVTLDADVDLVALDGDVEAYILPGRKVIDICNKIKITDDDMVDLDIVDDKAILQISKSRFMLGVLPGEQFPMFPAVPDTAKHYIPGDGLVQLLKNTVYATSGDQSGSFRCGVYLDVSDGELIAVATDARRFAIASIPYEQEFAGVLVPAVFAKVMISTLQVGDMWLTVDGNQLVCGQGDTVWVTLLYEAMFPDEAYSTVIGSVNALTKSTTCSKSDFANAVDLALLLCNPIENKIQLDTSDGLNVRASHDVGGAENLVDAEILGVMEPTGMNGVFVKNILATLNGDNIVMKYDNPGSGFAIHVQGDESVLGVLSPMHL